MKKVLIILLLLAAACKKKQEPTPTLLPDFPNEIGDHWRYRYTYSPTQIFYLDVDIIGTRTMPDGQLAKIWVYKTNINGPDTCFVVIDGQIAKVYGGIYPYPNPPNTYYEIMHYSFPLQVGTFYAYPVPSVYHDTSKVLSNAPLTVPAGTFSNTFKILKNRFGPPNMWTRDTTWFSPTVGMIKWSLTEIDFPPVAFNGNWELIEYSLK